MDEQRGVGDVMEIGWTWEWKRYSGGMEWNRLVGDSSVIDI